MRTIKVIESPRTYMQFPDDMPDEEVFRRVELFITNRAKSDLQRRESIRKLYSRRSNKKLSNYNSHGLCEYDFGARLNGHIY